MFNEIRKAGLLPRSLFLEDDAYAAANREELDDLGPEDYATAILDYALASYAGKYAPRSFWERQPFYIECWVEKIDLVPLFLPVCELFHIPIRNMGGWGRIGPRIDTLEAFAKWSRKGKRCVLLVFFDFDPKGLQMSATCRSNLFDVRRAANFWFAREDDLIVDRFGLNKSFIDRVGLTWIDGLKTGTAVKAGERVLDLADPKHRDFSKPYVQDYFKLIGARPDRLDKAGMVHGARKCEANALVVRSSAGRQLLRAAIAKYLSPDAPARYERSLAPLRRQVRAELRRRIF